MLFRCSIQVSFSLFSRLKYQHDRLLLCIIQYFTADLTQVWCDEMLECNESFYAVFDNVAYFGTIKLLIKEKVVMR